MANKTANVMAHIELDEAAFNAMMVCGMNEAKADDSRISSDVFADLRREMQECLKNTQ